MATLYTIVKQMKNVTTGTDPERPRTPEQERRLVLDRVNVFLADHPKGDLLLPYLDHETRELLIDSIQNAQEAARSYIAKRMERHIDELERRIRTGELTDLEDQRQIEALMKELERPAEQ